MGSTRRSYTSEYDAPLGESERAVCSLRWLFCECRQGGPAGYGDDGRRGAGDRLFGTDATQSTYLGKISTTYDKAGRISSITGNGIWGCAGVGAVIGTFVGGIGGALVAGLATGGIGAVPGFFLGSEEGATLGTIVGTAVCGLERLF